jgi:hypothetical protein
MIITYPVGLSAIMARRASKVMGLVLGEKRNAVHGCGQANPKGAAVVSRSRVAALAKDYGHSLRTVRLAAKHHSNAGYAIIMLMKHW